jgi:energy-coupling factor transporter ATP-binding protein EcfA2
MTVRDELFDWLQEQDAWQQDLARRLVSVTELEGEDWDSALAMVYGAFGAAPDGSIPPEPTPLSADDLPVVLATDEAPRLVAFGRMRGVGAASPDYELRFEPDGLTIVYGQNAAGKSTYVRGLKRICRTVDCDSAILGNVFSGAGDEKQTAKVELRIGGEDHARQVDLAGPSDLGLEAISVFDARCAELYVDSRNAVAYIPSTLLVLARLAATQDRMRAAMQAEEANLRTTIPTFPEFVVPSRIKAVLDSLSAGTSLDEVRRLAELSAEERSRLTELRAVTSSSNAETEAQAAEHDAAQAENLAAEVEAIGMLVGQQSATAFASAVRELEAARQAVSLAADEFEKLPVPGVGTEPWRHLWEAARGFVEANAAEFPPVAGARCPLCLERIGEATEARLEHFEAHIRGAVQTTAREAEARVNLELRALDPERVEACRGPFLLSLTDREPELHGALEVFLTEASDRIQQMRADPAASEKDAAPAIPADVLREWGKARSAHARSLREASEPEQRARLQQELTDLEARTLLASRVDDVEGGVRSHLRIAAIKRAHGALATNRITTTQRRLSETAVTDALKAKLLEELKSLRCDHLPIDLAPHATVGEVQLSLRLSGAQGNPLVSQVASEGEQRALSLAFFLAEVATAESDGGIIVDDPVSSLDDERREYIASRLAAEAQVRQVVVFTHDLPFMLDLMERVGEEQPLSVQAVWRLGAEVGRVDDHPPFKAMKLRARLGVLEMEVQQWDSQAPPLDFDEAWRRICDFYARMRITWERAVEERLFRGVVQRFQREVKTLALDDVVITPGLVTMVKDGMTRCSMFVHDEPPGASVSLPGRTQLAEDLEKLRGFEKETRQ